MDITSYEICVDESDIEKVSGRDPSLKFKFCQVGAEEVDARHVRFLVLESEMELDLNNSSFKVLVSIADDSKISVGWKREPKYGSKGFNFIAEMFPEGIIESDFIIEFFNSRKGSLYGEFPIKETYSLWPSINDSNYDRFKYTDKGLLPVTLLNVVDNLQALLDFRKQSPVLTTGPKILETFVVEVPILFGSNKIQTTLTQDNVDESSAKTKMAATGTVDPIIGRVFGPARETMISLFVDKIRRQFNKPELSITLDSAALFFALSNLAFVEEMKAKEG